MVLKRSHQIALVLFTTLALWATLTWPLPRYAARGIPSGVHESRVERPRMMISGDHLQLMYHFWLWTDMVAGKTPWMYNLYEFNTGDDEERYRPGAYFAPFSWAFGLGYALDGRALGWQFATLLSVGIAFAASWRLARRYSDGEWVAWAVAVITIAFPYRWYNLLSGSPTGFGMAWTPLLMLGLDRAIRDGSWRGGWWACVAIVFSGLAEKHVMFFNLLLIPVWSLLVWIDTAPWRRQAFLDSLRRALTAAPVVLGVGLTYAYANLYTRHLGESAMAKGRTLGEVAAFSPRLQGFWDRTLTDISSQVFPGWILPVLLLAALAWWLVRLFGRDRTESRRHLLLLAGLLLLGTVVVLLSTGPHGRGVGRDLFSALREWVPPYRMIRQSAKVMLVMPGLLVPLLAILLRGLPRARVLVLAGALLVLFDVAHWARPGVALLDRDNHAYAAVAQDAEAPCEVPRALVIPLWPGESHYASVYQYYASLHRLRLANGYSPVVSRRYVDEFFDLHRAVNQGVLSPAQIDDLRVRGIHYLVLHEDLFPEKVSPFPVAVTLRRLLEHPWLDVLAHDGSVWSFRLRAEPRTETGSSMPSRFFPTRRWEAESVHRRGGELREEGAVSGGRLVRLREGTDKVEFTINRVSGDPAHAWWVRVRGPGEVQITRYAGELEPVVTTQSVAQADWTWISWPVLPLATYTNCGLALRGRGGMVDVDQALLAGSDWSMEMGVGEALRIPAAALFHAGATSEDGRSVRFRPLYDPRREVLYGPRMPLPEGWYEAVLEVSSAAEQGTELGELVVGTSQVPLRAGQPVTLRWRQPADTLFQAAFRYARRAELEVEALTVRRVEGP